GLLESMTMVRSRRESALAGSPASSSLAPSSVSLSEAARWGDTPGVILASSELSSGNGGAAGTLDSGAGALSARGALGDAGVLDLRSCSRILSSWGSGLRAISAGGAGAGGGGGGTRGAGSALSRGGGSPQAETQPTHGKPQKKKILKKNKVSRKEMLIDLAATPYIHRHPFSF